MSSSHFPPRYFWLFGRYALLSRLPILFAALLLCGFTVVKDVNRMPEEKMVLFEMGKPSAHLAFFSNQNNRFVLDDAGALRLRIDNNDKIEAGVRWAGGAGLPESFSLQDYAYVLVTCRLEGNSLTDSGNGQVRSSRPDNLWCSFALFDQEGKPVASAGLAEVSPDQTTPAKTVTLRIPKLLFTYWGENPRPPIHGFGFQWSATRPTPRRDYTLVIERVALAN